MTDSWTETTLGAVIELHDNKRIPLSTKQRSQRQGKYPYYGASGIIDYIDDYIFDGRYLLISEDGANLVERNTPIAFFASDKFWVNNHAHIVRGIPGVSDDYFLMSYIQSANISGYITGTAQPKLSQANLKAIRLPLPPFRIQRKIAAVLGAYDDLIENNTRRIKILEEMAGAIYREWFVNFRFPGHEHVKMVESELGVIPQGWEVKALRDICELINYGYTAKASKECIGPKFLRITDIVPYMIDWDSVPYCEIETEKMGKYILEEGDIVIARTGATTGYAKRINKRHPESVFASYLVRIRIKSEHSNLFAGLIVESDDYKTFIKTNIGGAAQPNANAQVLTSFPVVVPPKEIAEKFDSAVHDLLDQREVLQERNRNLRRTRDLLLPKLISGEIDVSSLDIAIG